MLLNGYWKLQVSPARTPHGDRSREIWHPNLKRKETAMAIFDETYRVVGVESQRLTLRGLDSEEVLTVINADPETPITEEEHIGKPAPEIGGQGRRFQSRSELAHQQIHALLVSNTVCPVSNEPAVSRYKPNPSEPLQSWCLQEL